MPLAVTVEALSDAPTESATPLPPADVLAVQGDEVLRLDPFGAAALFAYSLGAIHGAEPFGDGLLIATDTGLIAYNDGLVQTELDGLVSGVTDLLALRSGLWLDTDAGLVVVRDDDVLQVSLDGELAHGFARGGAGEAGAVPVVWTATGDRAVAVRFGADGLIAHEAFAFFGPVDDRAAAPDGRVLALVEGWMVERRSPTEWVRLDVGEAVRELRGGRGSSAMWARTDTAWLHTDGGVWSITDVPVHTPVRDGPFGRLVGADPSGVHRYAVGLPLLLLDVPDHNVLTAASVRIVPTAPDRMPDLTVRAESAAGTTVDLEVVDYALTLDPEVLSPGPWTLHASADYGSESATAEATVVMGADFEPTWDAHIQPIYASQCTPCHEGDQGVVGLADEGDWLLYMEQGSSPDSAGILDRIRIDNMPSDTRVLSETEKFLVETWWAQQP